MSNQGTRYTEHDLRHCQKVDLVKIILAHPEVQWPRKVCSWKDPSELSIRHLKKAILGPHGYTKLNKDASDEGVRLLNGPENTDENNKANTKNTVEDPSLSDTQIVESEAPGAQIVTAMLVVENDENVQRDQELSGDLPDPQGVESDVPGAEMVTAMLVVENDCLGVRNKTEISGSSTSGATETSNRDPVMTRITGAPESHPVAEEDTMSAIGLETPVTGNSVTAAPNIPVSHVHETGIKNIGLVRDEELTTALSSLEDSVIDYEGGVPNTPPTQAISFDDMQWGSLTVIEPSALTSSRFVNGAFDPSTEQRDSKKLVREKGYTTAWRFDADQIRLRTFINDNLIQQQQLEVMRSLMNSRRTDAETVRLYRCAASLYETLCSNRAWHDLLGRIPCYHIQTFLGLKAPWLSTAKTACEILQNLGPGSSNPDDMIIQRLSRNRVSEKGEPLIEFLKARKKHYESISAHTSSR